MDYVRLAIAATIAVLTAACAFLAHGWYAEAQTFAEFRGRVDGVGQAQEERTRDRIALDKSRKEASDASYAVALTTLGNSIDGLRKQASPGGAKLSAAPADSRCPETQRCFDRAEFDAALGRYFERENAGLGRVVDLVVEGAKVKLRLDNAIRWANPQ